MFEITSEASEELLPMLCLECKPAALGCGNTVRFIYLTQHLHHGLGEGATQIFLRTSPRKLVKMNPIFDEHYFSIGLVQPTTNYSGCSSFFYILFLLESSFVGSIFA